MVLLKQSICVGRWPLQAADMAEEHKAMLVADAGAMYDEVVTVDLSHIEPRITGAFFPHKSWPLSQFAAAAAEHGWPMDIKVRERQVLGMGAVAKVTMKTCRTLGSYSAYLTSTRLSFGCKPVISV